MPYLSIVVPVYNKEKYLNEAVDSILRQTWKDFELILVDDGSSDHSGGLCDQYARLDPRVKVIHQNNQGVSAARNAGLQASQGDYIGFIDSDDFIEADMYELLLRNAYQYGADISVCGMKIVPVAKKYVSSGGQSNPRKINRQDILPLVLDGSLDWSANNKIYKAAIAKSVKFVGRINEDLLYVFLTHKQANCIVFDQVEKYCYLKRDNSVSVQRFNISQMESMVVSEKILGIAKQEYPEYINHAKRLDFISSISLLNLLILSFDKEYSKEYNDISSKIVTYTAFVKNTSLLSKKHRYAFFAFRTSPTLYQWMLKFYCYFFDSEVGRKVA